MLYYKLNKDQFFTLNYIYKNGLIYRYLDL